MLSASSEIRNLRCDRNKFLHRGKNMSKLIIPEGYKPPLDVYDTQKAISFIKMTFQARLAKALHLKRVSAPLFVTDTSGLNDNLNGVERPVSFDIPDVGECAEVVHSLAKWKRLEIGRAHV